MRRASIVTIALVLGLYFTTSPASGTTRFVKPGATGSGSSWSDASGDLQGMINASSSTGSDQVWVAAGTYKPGTTRISTISLKSGVKVFGGLAGNEDPSTFNLDNRDFISNQTILSGDIGTANDPTDNVYHVVTAASSSASPETRLDGFTITHGYANGFTNNQKSGAGIYVDGTNSNPTIANCMIEYNVATTTGGGVAIGEHDTSVAASTWNVQAP